MESAERDMSKMRKTSKRKLSVFGHQNKLSSYEQHVRDLLQSNKNLERKLTDTTSSITVYLTKTASDSRTILGNVGKISICIKQLYLELNELMSSLDGFANNAEKTLSLLKESELTKPRDTFTHNARKPSKSKNQNDSMQSPKPILQEKSGNSPVEDLTNIAEVSMSLDSSDEENSNGEGGSNANCSTEEISHDEELFDMSYILNSPITVSDSESETGGKNSKQNSNNASKMQTSETNSEKMDRDQSRENTREEENSDELLTISNVLNCNTKSRTGNQNSMQISSKASLNINSEEMDGDQSRENSSEKENSDDLLSKTNVLSAPTADTENQNSKQISNKAPLKMNNVKMDGDQSGENSSEKENSDEFLTMPDVFNGAITDSNIDNIKQISNKTPWKINSGKTDRDQSKRKRSKKEKPDELNALKVLFTDSDAEIETGTKSSMQISNEASKNKTLEINSEGPDRENFKSTKHNKLKCRAVKKANSPNFRKSHQINLPKMKTGNQASTKNYTSDSSDEIEVISDTDLDDEVGTNANTKINSPTSVQEGASKSTNVKIMKRVTFETNEKHPRTTSRKIKHTSHNTTPVIDAQNKKSEKSKSKQNGSQADEANPIMVNAEPHPGEKDSTTAIHLLPAMQPKVVLVDFRKFPLVGSASANPTVPPHVPNSSHSIVPSHSRDPKDSNGKKQRLRGRPQMSYKELNLNKKMRRD